MGTAAGLTALVGAGDSAASLGRKQTDLGKLLSDVNKASDLRGNTGELRVVQDLSSSITQVTPMLVGGQYAAGLGKLSSAIVRVLAVYGTSAAQGYESTTASALDHAREKKGGDLSGEEIEAILSDPKTQLAGFLNGVQSAALSRLFPKGWREPLSAGWKA